MSGFHGAFATGVASQQGTLTLPDTWFRPQFWDLLMLQLLRPNSSNLPCLYSTFHLEYPLVLSRFYLLMKINIKESEQCSFCNVARETILHLFWHCPNVQTIWTCVINSVRDVLNTNIDRKPENFLLGLVHKYNIDGLYLLLLLIKKYISLCRSMEEIPMWEGAKQYIQYYRNIDMYSMYIYIPLRSREFYVKNGKILIGS